MKSESRVPKHYRKGTQDWEAEYNMLHDDGVTCAQCLFIGWCEKIGCSFPSRDRCDYYPNRFKPKQIVAEGVK